MTESIFTEISIIVMLTTALAIVFRVFKQPLIISYLIAGILFSPYGLNVVSNTDSIATFSQLGIAFLLFMVGLNLNPRVIKEVGKVSLVTGLGQIIFTSLISYGIALLFGFSTIESLYIAIALTFSSTIVIMKLLSDKKDLESLYGRISVGFLIVQDIAAMVILMFVSSSGNGSLLDVFLYSGIKALLLLSFTFVIGKYILPIITKKLANQQELLILFSIAWCFALSTLFHYFDFSIEIGALLAGISLASSSFRYEISTKIRPLRDFFIVMFFIYLGTEMEFTNFQQYIVPISVFSVFILIGNPLIVMILMGSLGYTKKTGFLSGLTVAQISEFSLILTAMGVQMGHLEPQILSFVTVVGLITIAGSSYFIIYGKQLYKLLKGPLSVFEFRKNSQNKEQSSASKYDAIIIGYNHVGSTVIKSLKKLKKKFLVIDYNPDVIEKLEKSDVNCRYGDIEDENILEEISLNKVKLVISTIKDFEISKAIIQEFQKEKSKAIIMVVSEKPEDAIELYEHGASYVIMPKTIGGHHTSTLIESFGLDVKKFLANKIEHLQSLQD